MTNFEWFNNVRPASIPVDMQFLPEYGQFVVSFGGMVLAAYPVTDLKTQTHNYFSDLWFGEEYKAPTETIAQWQAHQKKARKPRKTKKEAKA